MHITTAIRCHLHDALFITDAESRLISLADPAQLRTGASGGGILPEDGGTYECVADTAFGALSLAVEIIVLGEYLFVSV